MGQPVISLHGIDMNTLLLSPHIPGGDPGWDLTIDAGGNIAMATGGYALAQDAASAIRTVQGEVYYDTTQGVPYWSEILGHSPPVPLMKAYFISAALTVPGIVSAVCYIAAIVNRLVTGQVQVRDATGQRFISTFSQSPQTIELETT